ncbi:uncharacterized protein PAC_06600 [Phialocephala subalpina]|uniref:Uncharacterized protein n=1 Tax=Phialocephala subalpina TaxID=576137 RepID=A0A1L7WVC7_9HELO|nr:uncharacterized protein PAC_06600 [Phialocephala subalpina]
MYLSKFLSVLPLLAGLCSAVPHHSKRAVTTGVQLYAYGTNISGLPLYYGVNDGLAYIGDNPPSTYSNLTWDIDSTGSLPWNATISNSSQVGTFYIVTTTSSYEQAGFISKNQTTNITDAATTGFAMFGGQVVYIDDSEYEAQFWAETTSTTGVWSLKWNTDGTSEDNSTPVVIKKTAPSS